MADVRLIDGNALKEDFMNDYHNYMMESFKENYHNVIRITEVIERIEDAPTIEAEPDNGWISVKDRLPEYNQKVLVVYNDVNYFTGVSIRRLIIAELAVDGYWMEGCTWHPDTSITHWRLLPEPPKGE